MYLVPAQPTNLDSRNITSVSFCITFNPPTNITQNGPITSYTVTYQGELFNTTEYNTIVSVNTVVYPLTESSSVCISDLEEYNNYTVLIRANNGAGEGVAAMIIVRTLEAGLYDTFLSEFIRNWCIYVYIRVSQKKRIFESFMGYPLRSFYVS